MKKTLLILILSVAFSTAFAQKQAVYFCPNQSSAADSTLEDAILKTGADDKSIDFLTENSPCDYSKSVKSNLNATINKSSFNLAKNHSFSLVKVGEDFFSIERFVFKTEKQAALIVKILEKRTDNQLKSEGVTFYNYFQIRNNVVFYLADRQVYEHNLPFFQRFKDNFTKQF